MIITRAVEISSQAVFPLSTGISSAANARGRNCCGQQEAPNEPVSDPSHSRLLQPVGKHG